MARSSSTSPASQSGKMNLFQRGFRRLERVWLSLGPGLITGASDDDPSGILTYSQAGASFGFHTLWTAWLSFPLMTAVQETCGRIGLVTNKGIAKVIKENYPKWVIYVMVLLTVPAIIINIGADLAGMGAVANLLVPAVPTQVFTVLAALLIVLGILFLSYRKLESIMKWLTLVLLVYLIVPFLVNIDWAEVLVRSAVPYFEFTPEYVSIIVAILGTTISPYLFFWEASMEVEEHDSLHPHLAGQAVLVEPAEIKTMRKDNLAGMFFSNFVMYFILLTTSAVLFKNGVHQVDTIQGAAEALRPLAGDKAYLLFAVGMIGTGFLAVPVLAGACSYLISEAFNWREGINLKLKEAKEFYIVIVISVFLGLGMNFLSINPVQALIWTATLYGLISPVLIGIILLIGNNRKIMGQYTNGWLTNLFGLAAFALMSVSVLAMAYFNWFN
jgi:NRAMP (natural resistance-associated macrophage protein)-like metal ion transporter